MLGRVGLIPDGNVIVGDDTEINVEDNENVC